MGNPDGMNEAHRRVAEAAEQLSTAYEQYVDSLIATGPRLSARQERRLRALIPPIAVPDPEQALKIPDDAGEILTPKTHTPAGKLSAHRREQCRVDYCGRIAP